MDCERFDRTTMDLLYGELDELTEAAAMRHLHHCTRCRDIWGHFRTTKELAVLPQEAPPDDMFSDIIANAERAQRDLPARERFSRGISVLAGYAMRPQLAMAALLLLMIGSSLIFVRSTPRTGEHVAVTERGVPFAEMPSATDPQGGPLIFEGDADALARFQLEPEEPDDGAASAKGASAPQPAAKESATRGTYNDAMVAYQEGRYAEAERLFSEAASAGSEQSASAALHEGHAARNGSGCQRAAQLYDSVAAKYPGSTVADEALWHAASCYRAMGQNQRAAAHYEKLTARPAFASRARAALGELSGTSPEGKSDDHGVESASSAQRGAAKGSVSDEADPAIAKPQSAPAAARSVETSEQRSPE